MEGMDEDEPPGRTPFFRAKNLERALRLKNLFIKFEGAGITGTQKDRISKLHVLRAKEMGYDTISLATCGNYGASISHFANIYGLKSVVAVPEYYAGERNEEIRANGSQILEVSAKYEDLVEYMRDRSNDENWYDSSPGSKNSQIDLEGYENIAYEIVSQLGRAPSFVSVPLGNGTTLAGIYSGFDKMYSRGTIRKIPRFIGSSTPNGNPIVASWRKRRKTVMELDPSTIRETKASEPLVSYRSYDGQKALNAIYRSNGFATYVTDEEMYRYSTLIEHFEMLSVLPASASSLAAVDKVINRKSDSRDIVVVLTGRSRMWTTQ
ncbi:MAG: pyridoxal-phosphate dependent enzyme [Candidatus Thermoplasmatota archaeon]|nr:pyridoxal-phosphate dependent enzyme [Candidatus Thermoplasmatota archaeon]MCL6090400.1 pyridoxal-phosphate dependent enzyme [Candidatus Thermoplasmatota archaeon]MDA8143642.1 pyridoxal-phosphate dependent enzyme [Thermoplasmatales archaeon]